MTNTIHRYSVLCLCAALLSLPACSTEEVGPPGYAYVAAMSGPDEGAFIVTFAPPAATYDDEQLWVARNRDPINYILVVDGAQLVRKVDGSLEQIILGEGDEVGIGYLPAGQHHLAVAPPNGDPPVFEGDANIVAGWQNELYLFGPGGAVQGRLVSFPSQPAPGTLHVSAINLVQGGATVEVVGCADATGCTPLSPSLALGDSFEGDFPAADLGDQYPYYTLDSGATLGLREVPTAALPTPPVEQLGVGYSLSDAPGPLIPPANMVIAPLYLSADGNFLALFE